MSDAIWIVVLGLVGTSLTSYLTYRIARNINSGQVASSAAGELWVEGRDLRGEYKAELIAARLEIANARAEVALLRGEAQSARDALVGLQGVISTLHADGTKLRAEIARLRKELGSAGTARAELAGASVAIRQLLAALKKAGIPPPDTTAVKAVRKAAKKKTGGG